MDCIKMVVTMNPCKCGYLGHPTRPCTCMPSAVERYRQRISGPLLDRIDLHVQVKPVEYNELAADGGGESTEAIRERVCRARAVQQERYKALPGVRCNAQLPGSAIRRWCRTDAAAQMVLKAAFEQMGYSARAYDRILRVARTIADLAGEEVIGQAAMMEALLYRCLDRGVSA